MPRPCLFLVVATFGAMVSSATSGVRRQSGGTVSYANVADLREYAGTGYGSETSHVVRMDLVTTVASGSGTTGSTTGSTASTTGSTSGTAGSTSSTAGTTGKTAGSTGGAQTQGTTTGGSDGAYRMNGKLWLLAPGGSGGIKDTLAAGDMLDVPPSMQGTPSGSTTSVARYVAPGPGIASLTMNGSSSGQVTISGTYGQNGAFSYTGQSGSYSYSAFPVSTGSHLECRFAVNKTVTGYSGTLYFIVVTTGTDGSGNPTRSVAVFPNGVGLNRRDATCTSVDSRTVYGQPNLDGEQPGDPNADLRNVNFYGWLYKGGLFAGNAPVGSADQSGTARLQAYVLDPMYGVNDPPNKYGQGASLGSTLSLLALGRPGKFPSPATLQMYLPSATDPNIASDPATVTWATRWELPSATAFGAAYSLGANSFPASGSEYVCSYLPGLYSNRLLLALSQEATAVTQGQGFWQYFASSGYEAGATAFPFNDSRPRLWQLNYGGGEQAVYYGN